MYKHYGQKAEKMLPEPPQKAPRPQHPSLGTSYQALLSSLSFPDDVRSSLQHFKLAQEHNVSVEKVVSLSEEQGQAKMADMEHSWMPAYDEQAFWRLPTGPTRDGNAPLTFNEVLQAPNVVHSAPPYSDAARRIKNLTKVLGHAKDYHLGLQDQLTKLLSERENTQRQLAEEQMTLSRRQIYLRESCACAEREEILALQKVGSIRALLAEAGQRQATAAAARSAALQDLRAISHPCNHPAITYLDLSLSRNFAKYDTDVTTVPQHCLANNDLSALPVGKKEFSSEICISQPLSISTAALASLPTPPYSPESYLDGCLPKPDQLAGTHDKATSGDTVVARSVFEVPAKHQTVASFLSQSPLEDLASIPKDITGLTCESPIGPYVRPPMPIEDMQRCIRCLLGKDKSLKTGNHARAFLGVPWSKIVSFDPDILLARGVSGIKEGSTGMASRLRMMTIIESALANQNNDAISAEVWERPTYFCESCQQRYPITVNTYEPVKTFEEYEKMKASEVAAAPTSSDVKFNPRKHKSSSFLEKGGSQDVAAFRRKRTKKKLRGSRPESTRAGNF